MPYIYKIVNDINQHIYIGKTYRTIEERWKEHCKDCYRPEFRERPLYRAMNKYGISNFHIELIEEVLNDVEDREIYWISYYDSYRNGYNATSGSDGRPYLDHQLIIKTYNEVGSVRKTAQILGMDKDQAYKILHSYNIDTSVCKNNWKAVAKIDPITDEILKIYPSIREAEKDNGDTRHIAEVCKGKRKTCKGYKWKYI